MVRAYRHTQLAYRHAHVARLETHTCRMSPSNSDLPDSTTDCGCCTCTPCPSGSSTPRSTSRRAVCRPSASVVTLSSVRLSSSAITPLQRALPLGRRRRRLHRARNACHGACLALHVRRGGLALETLVLPVRNQQRDEVRRVDHSEHTTLHEIQRAVKFSTSRLVVLILVPKNSHYI